ncbi:uncharacterized protein LOC110838350 [Zootermopsis nevadensis]|uniref:uncharacterized protein LOC110838350 n=1 Tax=Zootermopsis nevadensis TaxID=136037 RepID=UPI000B8E9DBC|nr:uncharacterized protein LOC110838350 [Zootermopsis nevadensis]
MATVHGQNNQNALDICATEETDDCKSQTFEENGNFEKRPPDHNTCNTEDAYRSLAQMVSAFDKADIHRDNMNNTRSVAALDCTNYSNLEPNTSTSSTDDETSQIKPINLSGMLMKEETEDAGSTTQIHTEMNNSSAVMRIGDICPLAKLGEFGVSYLPSKTSAILELTKVLVEAIDKEESAPGEHRRLTTVQRNQLINDFFKTHIVIRIDTEEAVQTIGLTCFKLIEATDFSDVHSIRNQAAETFPSIEEVRMENAHEMQMLGGIDAPDLHSKIRESSGQAITTGKNVPEEQRQLIVKQNRQINKEDFKNYIITRVEVQEALQINGSAALTSKDATDLAVTQSNRRLAAETIFIIEDVHVLNTYRMQMVGEIDFPYLSSYVIANLELPGQAISSEETIPDEQRWLTNIKRSDLNKERCKTYTSTFLVINEAQQIVLSAICLFKKPVDFADTLLNMELGTLAIRTNTPVPGEILKKLFNQNFGVILSILTGAGPNMRSTKSSVLRKNLGSKIHTLDVLGSDMQLERVVASTNNYESQISMLPGGTTEGSTKVSVSKNNFVHKIPFPIATCSNALSIKESVPKQKSGSKAQIRCAAVAKVVSTKVRVSKKKFVSKKAVRIESCTNVRQTKTSILRTDFS